MTPTPPQAIHTVLLRVQRSRPRRCPIGCQLRLSLIGIPLIFPSLVAIPYVGINLFIQSMYKHNSRQGGEVFTYARISISNTIDRIAHTRKDVTSCGSDPFLISDFRAF